MKAPFVSCFVLHSTASDSQEPALPSTASPQVRSLCAGHLQTQPGFHVNCQQKNQPFRLTLPLPSPLPDALQHLIQRWQPHCPPSKYLRSLSVRSCHVNRLTAAPSGEQEAASQAPCKDSRRSRSCTRGHGQVKNSKKGKRLVL